MRHAALAAALLVLASACADLSPLRGKFDVGEDAYAVLAARGPTGNGELYALEPTSGEVVPMTFSRAHEWGPAVAPDGAAVVFLRGMEPGQPASGVWVMNLISSAERQLPLPTGAPAPERVAWSRDGAIVYVRTLRGVVAVDAPPRPPVTRWVTGADTLAADSAFAVGVGEPSFARVEPCPGKAGDLCVVGRSGATPLAEAATAPVRWGGDSVGFITGGELVVRPLGPGRTRHIAWHPAPREPASITYFPGRRIVPE